MNTPAIPKAAGLIALCALSFARGLPARAEHSNEELAKAAQNPVANLISVPFQDNINFNYGPEEKTQNVLNIQPVLPVSLGPDWNLITRLADRHRRLEGAEQRRRLDRTARRRNR
ncbi:MAG TPA: hypothetical protein VLE22_00415 [Bryobacteraceae bacterium]|nr:hypothetical protein [Bryobacteraceae bacterium]